MAYLSWRLPRSWPASEPPSAAAADRPMSHSSRGPTNSETSMPWWAPILAISASSASASSIAPLPWETRLTVTPACVAASTTARSTAGPSTLGISIRKCAPSGNLAALGSGAASAGIPRWARISAPVICRRLSSPPVLVSP